jgi:hypothetical protein
MGCPHVDVDVLVTPLTPSQQQIKRPAQNSREWRVCTGFREKTTTNYLQPDYRGGSALAGRVTLPR